MLSRAVPVGILRCIQSTRVLGRAALQPLRCQQPQFFTNVTPNAEPVMLYQAHSPHNHVRVVEVGRRLYACTRVAQIDAVAWPAWGAVRRCAPSIRSPDDPDPHFLAPWFRSRTTRWWMRAYESCEAHASWSWTSQASQSVVPPASPQLHPSALLPVPAASGLSHPSDSTGLTCV